MPMEEVLAKVRGAFEEQKNYFDEYQNELSVRSLRFIKGTSIAVAFVYLVFQIISLVIHRSLDFRLIYLVPTTGIISMWPVSILLFQKGKKRSVSKYIPAIMQVMLMTFIAFVDTVPYPQLSAIYMPLALAIAPLLFFLPFREELCINAAEYVLFILLVQCMKEPVCVEHDFFQATIGFAFSIIAQIFVLNIRFSETESLAKLRQEQQSRQQLEQAKKEVERAYRIAEQANHAKTRFLNNVSHDIRTPMNAILGFTALALRHSGQTECVDDYLHKIQASGNQLLSLINDVLDMSRIESGRMDIKYGECSIPGVLHDLRNIMYAEIKNKNQDLVIDAEDVVNEMVICDKVRLNQVLMNCMSNAVKYTPPGGKITLRVIQKKDAPEGYADYIFKVCDTGVGMSPSYMEHLFEPFTREETHLVHQTPGTGLGMSIVKNIVDLMHGQITVESEEGKGSTFTISFRFQLGQENAHTYRTEEWIGKRALVADDDAASCLNLCKMFKLLGMRTEWTTMGKEAVVRSTAALEESDPFEFYVIDWLMPDMNGVETVRRIRKRVGDNARIILLTAYDWSDIEQEARQAGVDQFCDKPVFLSELYSLLSTEETAKEQTEDEKEEYDRVFRGWHVLLVDDVEINREIAQTILNDAGVCVTCCCNGKEAVDYLQQKDREDIDIVFMDVMMPVMDGYEATRRIRQLSDPKASQLPIVAITANAFEEDRQAALDAGMNEHISKPFSIQKLYAVIKKFS